MGLAFEERHNAGIRTSQPAQGNTQFSPHVVSWEKGGSVVEEEEEERG